MIILDMIASVNPATGRIVKKFREASKKEVLAAIARARVGQRVWAAKTKNERIVVMQRLKEVIREYSDEVEDVVRREVGYSPLQEGELTDIALGIDYYCSRYARLKSVDVPILPELLPKTSAVVDFVPHGVIGHIGIWNYPFWQTMISVIPALLAGNAVVYKPAEYTSMTGLKIADLLYAAGIPKDVFIPVIGGASVGKLIVQSDVDAIVFTGGIETGKWIVKNARIKPLVLELSGNDAGIVCADAVIDLAVRGVCFGTFTHAGQSCIRIKRVYVVKEIAKEFIDGLVKCVREIQGKSTMPMIRKDARAQVHARVQQAIRKGAKLLAGGVLPKEEGFFYPPTVLLVKDDSLKVMKSETFGPVCSVMVVKDEAEAIQRANASSYGLGGSVWTRDLENGRRIAGRLETGTVWINECCIPLVCGEYNQGWKQSSIPSSQERLMLFLKKRAVMTHASSDKRAWWP